MNVSDYDAVIFDFDGTLYDNHKMPLRLVLALPFHVFNIRTDRVVRRMLKGVDLHTRDAYFSRYCQLFSARRHMKPELVEQWYDRTYMPCMVRLMSLRFSARKNVPECFNKLKSMNIKTAVYSDYPCVGERMKAIGLDSCADFVTSSLELGAQKPCARSFEEIAGKLGVKADRCLVVGDREDTDGKGAENAGMEFVQIENHNHRGISWDQFAEQLLSQ